MTAQSDSGGDDFDAEVARFAWDLRTLRADHGRPSLKAVAARAPDPPGRFSLTAAQISKILNGAYLPDSGSLVSLVRALLSFDRNGERLGALPAADHPEVRQWEQRRDRLHTLARNRPPGPPAARPAPPSTSYTPVGEPLTGPDQYVSAAAFSSDGTLATVGRDLLLRLWDPARSRQIGGEKRPRPGSDGKAVDGAPVPSRAPCMACSGTGDKNGTPRVCPTCVGTGRVWRAGGGSGFSLTDPCLDCKGRGLIAQTPCDICKGSGRAPSSRTMRVRIPAGATDSGRVSVAFSSDGNLLATADPGGVAWWDPGTGELTDSPLAADPGGRVTDIAFSPVGGLLATAGEDDSVQLWDTVSGRRVSARPAVRTGSVRTAAFSPDGTLLVTTSDDGPVRLWDLVAGQQVGDPLTDSAFAAAFSPDGAVLATVSRSDGVQLWDPTTRRPSGAPFAEDGPAAAMAFSPDGTLLATGGEDGSVRLWDPLIRRQIGAPLTGRTRAAVNLAFSPDARILAVVSGETVWLHHRETDAPGPSARTLAARVVRADATRGVALPHLPLIGHGGSAVRAVAFAPDGGMIATAGGERDGLDGVRLWDPVTRAQTGGLSMPAPSPAYAVAFSPGGKLIAAGCADGSLRLWNTADSAPPDGEPLAGHATPLFGVAFSPHGTLIATAADQDRTVRIWESVSRKQVGELRHEDPVYGVAFSPGSTLIATIGGDRTVRLWDPRTRQETGAQLPHETAVFGLAFSPDGRILATAGEDGSVRLWGTTTRVLIGSPLTGHEGIVYGVAFSPGGTYLASTGQDMTVRLWSPDTGLPTGEPLTGHSGGVYAPVFSPDGTLLVTVSADCTVRRWSLPLPRE